MIDSEYFSEELSKILPFIGVDRSMLLGVSKISTRQPPRVSQKIKTLLDALKAFLKRGIAIIGSGLYFLLNFNILKDLFSWSSQAVNEPCLKYKKFLVWSHLSHITLKPKNGPINKPNSLSYETMETKWKITYSLVLQTIFNEYQNKK